MQNTKYKKVVVTDRLPTKNSNVILINCLGDTFNGYYSEKNNWIISTAGHFSSIEYWLEEVPDYEEEVLAMLERMKINIVFTSVRGFDKPLTLEEVDAFSKDVDDLIEKIRRGNVS